MIPEAVMTLMSQVVCTSLYQNTLLNMGIKLYNKLPQKKKQRLHTLHNFRKSLNQCFLQNAFYNAEAYLQAAL